MTEAPPDLFDNWLAAMRRGDFEAAWKQTDRVELPRRATGLGERRDHHLIWDGTPFADRTVLIRCWHGLGDTIQFLRYAPLLRQSAKRVVVEAQPMLLSLLEGMDGIDDLLDGWTDEPDPEHDIDIEVMELPYAFRHTAIDVPSRVPYLPVDRIRLHSPKIQSDGRKIGLVWAASSWNSTRSVPLAALAPLAQLPNVKLYSLQQGPELAELQPAPFPVTNLSPETTDIRQAAAAMLQMDAVVCVDTMAAHLAGALGVPVCLLLQHQADWRWQDERSDSPWYPTMRIFRQPTPGDWDTPVQELASTVVEQIKVHSSSQSPARISDVAHAGSMPDRFAIDRD